MFTGIIEATGTIVGIRNESTNILLTVESPISSELKVDQSVSHDGVCLTVVKVSGNIHEVVVVEETLKRSNFKNKKVGQTINLERSLMMNGRLDGHIVQGHVDEVATCKKIAAKDGSWIFTFKISTGNSKLIVDKGSVCINGVSLTVIKPDRNKFSVAVIPFTFEHTNFKDLIVSDEVNIEFDIIGKYVKRMLQ